eukprot:6478234-Amphidinium_carterae.1
MTHSLVEVLTVQAGVAAAAIEWQHVARQKQHMKRCGLTLVACHSQRYCAASMLKRAITSHAVWFNLHGILQQKALHFWIQDGVPQRKELPSQQAWSQAPSLYVLLPSSSHCWRGHESPPSMEGLQAHI